MGAPTEQQLRGGSANRAVDHPSEQIAAILNCLEEINERVCEIEIFIEKAKQRSADLEEAQTESTRADSTEVKPTEE